MPKLFQTNITYLGRVRKSLINRQKCDRDSTTVILSEQNNNNVQEAINHINHAIAYLNLIE